MTPSVGIRGPGDGNRLWHVELELRGPCGEVVLDCGIDGRTRLLGPFLEGEQRSFAVPVPARSPLGVEGLTGLPLPRVEILPPGSRGQCRILGWSPVQPGEQLERGAGVVLGRPRPPLSPAAAVPGPGELLAVILTLVLLLRFHRRALAALALAFLGAALAFALALERDRGGEELALLEVDADSAAAVLVRGVRDAISLPAERLEVLPEGSALEIELRSSSPPEGAVRSRGASLYGLSTQGLPDLTAARNGWSTLEETWIRSPEGAWRSHGRWPTGAPLADRPDARDAPGWLSSGLAPGRGVLLGRLERGGWVRVLGFAGKDERGGD